LKKSWATHHPIRVTAMFGALATTSMPSVPPASPTTIQGLRMPHRDEVRSLIRPKNGLPTMATSAPTAVTRARFRGACSIPTRESTFNASVTSSGAIRTREVLMNASAYSAMNSQPTRRTGACPGSPARSSTADGSDTTCSPRARMGERSL
jgi:hypothetical protein